MPWLPVFSLFGEQTPVILVLEVVEDTLLVLS
jgi:hypothetical protein